MTVNELIEQLKQHALAGEGDLEVYFPCIRSFGIGNMREVDKVKTSIYGFFGKDVPCIILDMDRGESEGEIEKAIKDYLHDFGK